MAVNFESLFSQKYKSPENQAITTLYHKLVLCIKRSPDDTMDKLFSKEMITAEEMQKFHSYDNASKAREIVGSISDQLTQCTNSAERTRLYKQFTESLYCTEAFKKELEEALQMYHREDQPREQAERYQLLQTELSKWEDNLHTLKIRLDEILLQEAMDKKMLGLEALLASLKEHRETLSKIGEKSTRLTVIDDDYRERILGNDRAMEAQLKQVEAALKLERVKQTINQAEKDYAEKIEYLRTKEQEFAKRKNKVFQKFKNIQEIQQDYQRKQRDRQQLTDDWEELVAYQRNQLTIFKDLLSEAYEAEYLKAIHAQIIETQDRLQYSRELRNHLENLDKSGETLQEMETTMRERMDLLSKQKEAFCMAKTELESINDSTEDYRQTMQFCEEKLEKCGKMVRDCDQEIKMIANEYQRYIEEAKETLKQLRECRKSVSECTDELSVCERRVSECLVKLKTKSQSLSEKLDTLAKTVGVTVGGASGAAGAALLGTFLLGPAGIIAGAVLAGALGGTIGYKQGESYSKEKEQEIENVRYRLYECEDNLQKCSGSITELKKIVQECKKELDIMQKCIKDMERSSSKLTMN